MDFWEGFDKRIKRGLLGLAFLVAWILIAVVFGFLNSIIVFFIAIIVLALLLRKRKDGKQHKNN